MTKKKRAKKVPNVYWNKNTMDNYITHYNALTDEQERNDYFTTYLYQPMQLLCEAIVNRFKFQYTPFSNQDLMIDLLSHLVSKLYSYKIDAGASFGYLSVVAKNYCVQMNQRGYESKCKHISIHQTPEADDYIIQREMDDAFSSKENVLPEFTTCEFLDALKDFWVYAQTNTQCCFRKNYSPVLQGVFEVIDNAANVETELYGKKGFNLLVEATAPVKKLNIDVVVRRDRQRLTRIIRKIVEINKTAYRFWLKTGNLNGFKPFLNLSKPLNEKEEAMAQRRRQCRKKWQVKNADYLHKWYMNHPTKRNEYILRKKTSDRI